MFSTFLLCQIIIITIICQTLCYELAEQDLKCFNDYEAEMKCSFPSDSLESCSGYKLNILRSDMKTFSCMFDRSDHNGSCECKIKVRGFVVAETFTIKLLNGTNLLLTKEIETQNSIKPKAPVLSVQKTESGNLNVTWDDKYKKGVYTGRNFADSLQINLAYWIEGGHEMVSNTVQNSVGFFEIFGANLQPNVKYILTARMSTDYSDHKIFSDQSAPVYFTSPSSPNEIVKMVVPPLCFGLIIIICLIFFCVLRMKTNWWDKISKPKIDANLKDEKTHILLDHVTVVSPIHVEITQLKFEEEKHLISAVSVDSSSERSSHSAESTPVDYGRAGSGSGSEGENIKDIDVNLHVQNALDEDLKLFFSSNKKPNTEMSLSYSNQHNRKMQDSGNCSGSSVFSNKTYISSATDSSFLEHVSCDDGYQSVNGLKEANDADVHVKLQDDADENFITQNLVTSNNPLYPSMFVHDGHVTPSDEGYQTVQELTKSTEGQWSSSISTEQALTACGALKFPNRTSQELTASVQPISWASSLNISPAIQIDCSYQSF